MQSAADVKPEPIINESACVIQLSFPPNIALWVPVEVIRLQHPPPIKLREAELVLKYPPTTTLPKPSAKFRIPPPIIEYVLVIELLVPPKIAA